MNVEARRVRDTKPGDQRRRLDFLALGTQCTTFDVDRKGRITRTVEGEPDRGQQSARLMEVAREMGRERGYMGILGEGIFKLPSGHDQCHC